MTDEGTTHYYGDDCPSGHLPSGVAETLDLCIEAIKRGDRELHVHTGDVSMLRYANPVEVDAYASVRLPAELWGTELRLVWRRGRVESASLTFLEGVFS